MKWRCLFGHELGPVQESLDIDYQQCARCGALKRWQPFWTEWQGTVDRIPTMWTKRLLELLGCRVDLHKFVRADDGDCFHTHPAYAVRIVLRGGYVEELEDGRLVAWRVGDVGLVAPSTSHRVDAVLYGRAAYTLWIRAPKITDAQLRGLGWPKSMRWSCQRCGARGFGEQLLGGEACPDCGLMQ